MNTSRLQFLFIVALILQGTRQLNVQIFPKKEYCFGVEGGEEYRIEYVVSGINERNTLMTVRDNSQRQLFNN